MSEPVVPSASESEASDIARLTRSLPPADEIPQHSFYQLVRRLLAATPEAAEAGGRGPASRESIRFRPSLSLAFAPGDVSAIEVVPTPEDEVTAKARLTVHFLGLYGPSSPMPNHFTEELLWATENETERDFLDVFHHRLISFVWRSWARVRHHVRFGPRGRDEMTGWYLALAGVGTRGMPEAARLPAVELLRAAGLLGAGTRSAAALRGFLRDALGVPVEIEPNHVRQVALGADQRSRLGRAGSRLGDDLVLGESLRDATSSFGIVLGPLSGDDFDRFLPGEPGAARLERLTNFFLSDPLVFEVELVLERTSMGSARLGAGARLGWRSWLLPSPERDGRVRLSRLTRAA